MKGNAWHTVLVVGALLTAGTANAQPVDVDAATRVAARQLAEEGLALYDKGQCDKAADKLLRAHEMVHVPTAALYAGKCLEKLGRLVDASEAYLAATKDEIEPGASATIKKAQADAAKAREALLPRIPTFTLTLKDFAPDVTVTLDGKALPSAALGVTRPIDPGKHVAEARQGDKVLATREFAVEEGDHGEIALAPQAASPPTAPATSRTPPAPAASSGASVGPWVVGGVGLAALVAGSVTGALVLVEKNNIPQGCMDGSPPTCPPGTDLNAANSARSLGAALAPTTTVLLVAGGAAVAAGGIWLGLTRSSGKTNARVGVGPLVGGATWRVEGSW